MSEDITGANGKCQQVESCFRAHPDLESKTREELFDQLTHSEECLKLSRGLETEAWYVEEIRLIEAALARRNGSQDSFPSLKEGIGKETNWRPLSAADLLSMEAPEIPWLWDGLIPQGSLFLISAFMKVGKSTLAYRLAVSIAQGFHCLDRETQKTGVLILAVEEHIRDIRRRLERFDMTADMPIYVVADREQARDLDHIREFLKAKEIGLILIDSLSRWWDVTDENNNMEVIREVSPLLDLAHDASVGVSVGLIVHERKTGGEDGRGIRGGSSLFGLVDQALLLDRRPGEASNKRLLKTLGRYEESPRELIIELVGTDYRVLGTPAEEGQAQAIEKVRAALTPERDETLEPMDVKTLAAEAGLTQKMTRKVLEAIAGEVVKSGAGKRGDPHLYSLLSQYSSIGKESNSNGSNGQAHDLVTEALRIFPGSKVVDRKEGQLL